MTSTLLTSPAGYSTNTDERDVLSLDVAADLTAPEAVASATCELWQAGTNVAATGFPSAPTVSGTVVSQEFDARVLTPAVYRWIWTVTLTTGAVRSYRTSLAVVSHD
jgi:hypothetical protein